MSIDRGDSHFDDAGSWEKACRHMGLFLAWAMERGFASDDHEGEDASSPTEYFIGACDTKLTNEDLNDEGNAFVEAAYEDYLGEVNAYASSLGVGDYDIVEDEATKTHFYAWLDARLGTWRSQRN
ncbi:MAG: hypothetical protein ABI321_08390 [Polyangia bacterium]